MDDFRNVTPTLLLVSCFLCSTLFIPTANAAPPEVGLATRVPWTTSNISGSPDPPLPYTTQRVFPKLKFEKCIDMAMPPGSRRFFLLEQSGKIFSFPNAPDIAQADLAIDLKAELEEVRNVYALAFHPDFATNRYCYACCIQKANQEDGSQIIRFTVSNTDPPTIDAASRKVIITWPSGSTKLDRARARRSRPSPSWPPVYQRARTARGRSRDDGRPAP